MNSLSKDYLNPHSSKKNTMNVPDEPVVNLLSIIKNDDLNIL